MISLNYDILNAKVQLYFGNLTETIHREKEECSLFANYSDKNGNLCYTKPGNESCDKFSLNLFSKIERIEKRSFCQINY